MKEIHVGDESSFSRTFSREDIMNFAQISYDTGRHHVNSGKKLLVHGLLLATLPTKLGGDLNFIAKDMEFYFRNAVYEGDIILCIARLEKLVKQKKRLKCKFSFRCFNQNGVLVLEGISSGMIWNDGVTE